MNRQRETPRVGELRPSQILTTFGIGSIVDLPHLSVMVMGLEDWPRTDYREINEGRLLASVRDALGRQVMSLRTPPVVPDRDRTSPFEQQSIVGVPVAPFPRWMVCPRCRRLAPLSSNQFVLKTDPYRTDRARYVHENCRMPGKMPTVIPARFIVACKNGHLDDFPWVDFVHRGRTLCAYKLQLLELGPSGEASDVFVRCETCETSRPMSDAFHLQTSDLPMCRGRRPHLRDFEEQECQDGNQRPIQVRAMLQGASNSWFPLMLSALSVPESTNLLKQLVIDHWSDLYDMESESDIAKMRRRNLLREFSEYSESELLAAIEEKKAHDTNEAAGDGEDEADEIKDLKTPEWSVFINPAQAQRTKDFRLREVKPPSQYANFFTRIVLAERLREVRSLIGFTRIESPGDYENPAEFPATQRMEISRGLPKWVPSNEIRGEGIFFQFNEDEMVDWMLRVGPLDREFFNAHKAWRAARGLPEPEENYPGSRFVLLHSFAHALIRQLSLECGYTAASLRERIYSRNPGTSLETMAGVLIYTAAPDSEGTLGGLVSLGEPNVLRRHLSQALDSMRLCSSDPLCSEHHAGNEGTSLHAASCHACLFAPETSCERGNKYLDRSVLVATVDEDRWAFFDDGPAGEASDTSDTDKQTSDDVDDGVLELADLLSGKAPVEFKIRISKKLAVSLGLSSPVIRFRSLSDIDDRPSKNGVVIVRHDQMPKGNEKVQLAIGKLLWQKQVDVGSGDTNVLVTIRGDGSPVKFKLTSEQWEQFRPLAVQLTES